MTLRSKTFSAIRWTTTAAITRAVLQVGQVAILARILSPEDYGLMAMVTVVLSFGVLFADMGVNSAFIQRQDVLPEQRSSLYWFNVLISLGITALVVAASPLLANFFGDARLTPLVMLSTATFVLGALGAQIKMAAEKTLNFRPLVLVEITAGVAGVIVAVLAAMAGWGVYSLVVAGIFTSLLNTILAWTFLSHGWRPLCRLRIADIKPFLGFGGALVANNMVSQMNMIIDLFLGGRLLSAASLGLYSIPRQLTLQVQFLVNPIITRVGFPLIAQVQSDANMVKTIYLKTINMTASTNAPIYISIAFFAPEIVSVLLGPDWERSGGLLRSLALWGAIRSTGNPVGSLVLGLGRADLLLKWNSCLIFIISPAVWLGSYEGPEGIALVLLLLQVTLFIPGWYFLVRPLCKIGLMEYVTSALKPYLISVVAITPVYLMTVQFESVAFRLIMGFLLSGFIYVLISLLKNREWTNTMMQLVGGKVDSKL